MECMSLFLAAHARKATPRVPRVRWDGLGDPVQFSAAAAAAFCHPYRPFATGPVAATDLKALSGCSNRPLKDGRVCGTQQQHPLLRLDLHFGV